MPVTPQQGEALERGVHQGNQWAEPFGLLADGNQSDTGHMLMLPQAPLYNDEHGAPGMQVARKS